MNTVTGNTTNSNHVTTGANGAILDGFIITAGYGDGNSCPGPSCGGGMYNNQASPTVNNVLFSGNSAGWGGGMENYNNSSPSLTNVTFNANWADNYGGGMGNWSYCSPSLTNVTFSGNSSYSGGGLENYDYSSPNLTNVTFSNNSALYGGGMFNLDYSSPGLTNVTFSTNSAEYYGGGMFNDTSSPIIHNTILWGNTANSSGVQIHNVNGSNPQIHISVVQDGCPSASNCPDILITANPLLGPLGDYGGFTQTIPLFHGSSAHNATSANCPTTDQRGVARGNPCDIGAFEGELFPIFMPVIKR
jgi:hypothetical protein